MGYDSAHMKKLLLFLLLVPLFAQDSRFPNDPQGYNFLPADMVVETYCTYILDASGIAHNIPFVPYLMEIKTYPTSGWHGHGVGSTTRPLPYNLVPLVGSTGPTGCVNIPLKFPGQAGWYTLTVVSPNLPMKGVNFYTKFYEQDRMTHAPLLLVPYNYVEDANQPFDLHPDPRHISWRYVRQYIKPRILSASYAYRLTTGSNTPEVDLLDITRCSLPDGGIADNEYPGTAPSPAVAFEWVTRTAEEHATGAECDITNPQGHSITHAVLALQTIQQSLGVVGAYDPDGHRLTDAINFWLGKDVWHVTWGSSPILRSRPPQ